MIPAPSVTSQQQAQETLYGYMRKTLEGLPAGTLLDNTRYGGAGGTVPCDDRIDSENAPVTYYDSFDMRADSGSDYNELIVKIGDLWKSWGWQVVERPDSDKPNRHVRTPDGYELRVEARPVKFAGYPPTFGGRTPCFPPQLRDDYIAKPRVITRDKLDYAQPSESAAPDKPSNLFN